MKGRPPGIVNFSAVAVGSVGLCLRNSPLVFSGIYYILLSHSITLDANGCVLISIEALYPDVRSRSKPASVKLWRGSLAPD